MEELVLEFPFLGKGDFSELVFIECSFDHSPQDFDGTRALDQVVVVGSGPEDRRQVLDDFHQSPSH